MSAASVGKFISTLLASREQAHVFHLRTKSYAAHKALQAYYEGIVPLLDDYAETYMGSAGRLIQFPSTTLNRRVNTNANNTKVYFRLLFNRVSRMKLPKNSYLQNIRDEIEALIKQTLYMLTLNGAAKNKNRR